MLQQTRVETVLNYYPRFLSRFPDVASLARASHEEVLRYWQGLGYYRRIVHFHRAARQLHKSAMPIPSKADELRALPGIGAYTAAALASIAFGHPSAAVDGNVIRVLARLLGIQAEPKSVRFREKIHVAAQELISHSRPGDMNQAWMDLGRSICAPRNPRCADCPVAAHCLGFRSGAFVRISTRAAGDRPPIAEVAQCVALFTNSGKLLVRRRPVGGLWSGLWEFPNIERQSGTAPGDAAKELAQAEGLVLTGTPRWMGILKHRLTHRAFVFSVVQCPARSLGRKRLGWPRKWVSPSGLGRLPVSTAHRNVYRLLDG